MFIMAAAVLRFAFILNHLASVVRAASGLKSLTAYHLATVLQAATGLASILNAQPLTVVLKMARGFGIKDF